MPRLSAAMLIAVGMAIFTSGSAAPQGNRPTVVIQDYPGTGNMLYRVAVAKGSCEKYGIACKLQIIPSPPLGVQALLSRSIDMAFGPPEVQINAISEQQRS